FLQQVECSKLEEPAIELKKALRGGDLLPEQRELLLSLLMHSKTRPQIASELRVNLPQLKRWLDQLEAEGAIRRRRKASKSTARQSSLFEGTAAS
ncbi:MAG: hypothetical protein ACHQ7M_15455, partial [Chloroflexota bacterium]